MSKQKVLSFITSLIVVLSNVAFGDDHAGGQPKAGDVINMQVNFA